MITKFVLIVGDDDDAVLSYGDGGLSTMRDLGLNFEQSPSVGAIYEVFVDELHEMIEDIRAKGLKTQAYSTLEKAQSFMFKTLGFSADGTLGETQVLTSWGGET